MGAGLQTQERYAAASLFTLALHSTQVDSGLATSVQGLREELRAWGQPPEEDELHLADCCTEERRALNDAAWKAFWGWDCCGPDGLLERVYRNLAIPARAWPGLKQLPETGGLSVDSQQHYISLVRSHMSVLDPELAHGPLGSRSSSRPGSSASLAGAGGSSGDLSAGGPQPTASRLSSSLGRGRASSSTGDMMTGDATSGSRSSGSLAGACSTADAARDPFATSGDLPLTGHGRSGADASADDIAQRVQHAAAASSAAGQAAAPSAGHSAALQVTDDQRGSEAGLQAAGHRPSGCLSDDSDVEEDRQRLAAEQQLQQVLSPAGQGQHSAAASQPDAAAAAAALATNGSSAAAMGDHLGDYGAGSGVGELAAGGPPAVGGGRLRQGDAGHFEVAAPLPSDAEPAQHPLQQAFRAAQAQLAPPRREGPAPTVVEAVWELLDACVAGPRLDSSPEGSARRKRAAQKFSDWRPAARWYDARARVALKRVAGWLGVPWSKAITFETLLAHQAAAAESKGAPTAGRSLASWAKIGAASVGAGALFAVTGGLAAPAIAAGLGSAITVGGSTLGIAGASAAGGTVASVFGTSAGAAVLGGSIGIAGGNFAGSRTARRIADLKEFGFWSLPSEPGQRGRPGVSAAPGTSAAASPESDASAAATDGSRRSADGRSRSGEADAAAASSLAAPNRPPGDAAGGAGAADARPRRLSRRQSSGSGGQAASPAAVLLPQDLGIAEGPFPASPLAREPHAGSGALLDRLSSWTPMDSHSRHNSAAAADSAAARPCSDAAQPGSGAARQQHSDPFPAVLSADGETLPQAQSGVSESLSQAAPDPAAAQAGADAAASAAAASLVRVGGNAEAAQLSLMDTDLQPSTGYPTAETPGHFVSPAAVPPAADAAQAPELPAPPQQPPAAQQPAASEEGKERKWWHLARGRSGDLGRRPLLPAPFDPARARDDNLQLSITICISGWIAAKSDFVTMWEDVQLPDSERYTLVWESQELLELNAAVVDYLKATAAFEVGKLAVQKFLFTGLVAAVALPLALLSAASLLDNPWAVATERAMKAGRLLAHVLMQGAHGDRPVTLIGHSMGARVIFHCLLELCRHNCKGVVENAVLLGAPVSIRVERWRMATSSVAGRFINGYSRRDWVLGLVYRGSNGFIKGAGGISPVDCPGVENVNLSNLISGHFDYATKIDEIVDLLQL